MKILIVEDEPKTGEYLRQGLNEAGFVADLAANGSDGLHLALHGEYDLVILDVMLPELDGWQVLASLRRRGLEMPIVILVRRKRLEDIPVEVMDYIDGYIFLSEETPDFIARNLVSRLKQYAETLKTPFFGALVDYAEEGNQLWTCPGHNGGIFYNRSPIGRIFVEHLGEAVFRDDAPTGVTMNEVPVTYTGNSPITCT